MSRRGEITMTPEEITAYIAEQRVINIATMGKNGRPHLTPLWYYPYGEAMATWTFGKSQKAVNLRREPRATILIESGESYETLRGISMEADIELVDDLERVTEIGLAMLRRYAGTTPTEADEPALKAAVDAQATKRVGLIVHPTKIVSWDHRKLGGGY